VYEFNLNLATKYWSDLLDGYTNVAKIPHDYFNKEYVEKISYKSIILDESVYLKLIDYSTKIVAVLKNYYRGFNINGLDH